MRTQRCLCHTLSLRSHLPLSCVSVSCLKVSLRVLLLSATHTCPENTFAHLFMMSFWAIAQLKRARTHTILCVSIAYIYTHCAVAQVGHTHTHMYIIRSCILIDLIYIRYDVAQVRHWSNADTCDDALFRPSPLDDDSVFDWYDVI